MRKFKKHKVYSSFKDNILRVDLADMQLISGHNNGIRFLLCVSDPLVDIHGLFLSQSKKSFTITDAFQNILDECRRHVAKSKECKLN